MPLPLKKLAIKLLLGFLALLKALGRFFLIFLKVLTIPLVFLWRIVLRRIAFLFYNVLLRMKIAAVRFLPPFRRTFFAVFGHRYVVHALMFIIVMFVTTRNLYARGKDLGQDSTQALIHGLLQVPVDYATTETAESASDAFLDAAPAGTASATSAAEIATEGGIDELLTYDQSGVVTPLVLPGSADKARRLISKPEEYVVQPGDTISVIAQNYGVSINTVLWANDMTARSLLRVGQKLKILPVTGVIHKIKKGETIGAIAKKYGSDVEKILAANRVNSAEQIQIGEELVIPDGKPPALPAPRLPQPLGNVRDIFRPTSEAPPGRVADGINLAWPTDQKRINQYFRGSRHPGIDINGRLDNAIYAADAGIVTFSGWNKSGYGNMILIDHGNGVITRYAHNSKHFVKAGDQVAKGQTIAMIGSTGRSTGPHVHFEIYVGGVRRNPFEFYR